MLVTVTNLRLWRRLYRGPPIRSTPRVAGRVQPRSASELDDRLAKQAGFSPTLSVGGQSTLNERRDAFGTAGIAVGKDDHSHATVQEVLERTSHSGRAPGMPDPTPCAGHRLTEIELG